MHGMRSIAKQQRTALDHGLGQPATQWKGGTDRKQACLSERAGKGRIESAAEVFEFFSQPLPTAEIAAVMAEPMMPPNTGAVLAELQELTAEGKLVREPLGDDALWRAAV